jgi:hypothetical protein
MAVEITNDGQDPQDEKNQVKNLLGQSDFLNPASIEQPLTPRMSWEDNFVNPTNYIKNNYTGISPDLPPSQAQKLSGVNAIKAMALETQQYLNSTTDVSDYQRPYAYDASPSGTFRDRYKAYGQETFNKIGFHPLIDNETWFNQNTTFGDDLKRWFTHTAWPMFSKGVLDPVNSYRSVINGDGMFNADEQSARDYQYFNALGQSTKGGLGGFTVNLLNSASYSMGILTEGAIEGALIGSLFGGGAKGAVQGSTSFLRKLANLPKGLVNLSKGTAKILDDVKNYTNINEAKRLWTNAGKNFVNFANPLENTTKAAMSNLNNLDNLAKSSTTAGALWHDIMAMNLALSEGKLEGGFTRYETYDRLYNEFIKDEKKTPTLAEQEGLMRQASKGSWVNALSNTALIYYTNKIVFPTITKANFVRGIPKFSGSKVVTNVGKEYQILFEPGKKLAEGQFIKQQVNLKNALKSLAKPATYGRVGLNYFKANVFEGLQEVSQDILQEATQNYYVETFKNEDARNFRYGTGLLSDAIKKQWSSQGLEVFLSGFLMGTILQAPGKIKTFATIGYNDYFKNEGKSKQYIKDREQLANDIVNELNIMYQNANYFFDPRINNYAQQALASKVIDNPEEHTDDEISNSSFTTFFSAVMSSLQRGTFDTFIKHYENYKQASPSDIEEAWDLKPGEGEKALELFDKSLENAKKIKNRFEYTKKRFEEYKVNPDDFEPGTEEHRIAQVYNAAYGLALTNQLFFYESFDQNSEKLKVIYDKLGKINSLSVTPIQNITALTDPEQLRREVNMLASELETLEKVETPEANIEVSRVRERLELYSDYLIKLESIAEAVYSNRPFMSAIAEKIRVENPDLSDEETAAQTIENLVKEIDEGKSHQFLEFKDAFRNLLIGLNENLGSPNYQKRLETEQEINNIGGIDSLFDSLMSVFVINNENASLNTAVNILSSPDGFYEHVVRNFKFMKDLYRNKENIVREIVNQEISAIERNTLLNTLADQGIYVDLDEFAKWIENPSMTPSYFIDETNQRIIDNTSLLYKDYEQLFLQAAKLEAKKPAGEQLNQKEILDKNIQQLEQERDNLIEKERQRYSKEFEKNYGITPEQYEIQESERIKSEELTEEERKKLTDEKVILQKAFEQLQSKNYIEVQAAAAIIAQQLQIQPSFIEEQTRILQQDKQKNKEVYNKSQEFVIDDITDPQEKFNTQIDAAINQIVLGPEVTTRLEEIELELNKKSAAPQIDVENTKEYKLYQEAVEKIKEKYDGLIAGVKDEFAEKGIDEDTIVEYTTKTDFENFDTPSQVKITQVFDAYLESIDSLDIKTTDPSEYERLRSNWLETQSDFIKQLNEEVKQRAAEKAERLSKAPILKFGKTKITANTSTRDILRLIEGFEKTLERGEIALAGGKVKTLTEQNIQDIKDDIEALKGYLKSRVDSARPESIAEEVYKIIEDNILNKQDQLEDVLDENGNKIGRKFKDSEDVPERTTKVAEQIENALLNKKPFVYNLISDFDMKGEPQEQPLKKEFYDQFFNENVEPADRVRLFMEAFTKAVYSRFPPLRFKEKLDAIQRSLETDGSYEGLRETIKEYVFKDNADSGNVVDDLIRMFLTPSAATKSNFVEFDYNSTVDIKGVPTKISDVMSRKAFDKLFAPVTATSTGGIITKFRLPIIDNSYIVLSNDVKLFDKTLRDNGITGEVDLILLNKDGSVSIVDIKTQSLKTLKSGNIVSKWKNFGNRDKNKYEKSTYFRAQQSIYGYMFHNNTGITPSLKLMPLDTKLSKTKMGYIEDIDLADLVPLGQETIDLEYLPKIEDYGIVKKKPENIKLVDTESKTEVPKLEPGIQETDPSKITLNDNIGKPVMYRGRQGKLIQLPDGNFGVEVIINNDLSTLELTRAAVEANLEIEKGEFGNLENAKKLEKQLSDLNKAIDSQKGLTEVFPVQRVGVNISNGNITLDEVGLSIIAPIESIGEVSTIEGEVVRASFSNQEETIASINGVRYDAYRDDSGNINALSYMSNSKELNDIEKEIGGLNNKLNGLQNKIKTIDNVDQRRPINLRISQLQLEVKRLTARRNQLLESNQKIFIYGANANNYIFALNRLPNNFQKLNKDSNTLDEKRDLKEIDRLSLSTAISQAITEILVEEYPEELDQLFDGTFDYKFEAKGKINKWIDNSIEKLYELGYTVINRGDLVDDIENQINALLDLKNDIALIKLTRDKKIKNYEEVRKIFTEKQQVQDRTSVPKNERTSDQQSKRVSRSGTREDLEKIVKRKQKEVKFEDVEVQESPRIAKIKEATLSTLEEVYQKEYLEANKKGESTAELTKAKNERLKDLNENVRFDTVEKGEKLISKTPIFTDQENDIVIIASKNKGKKTVRIKNFYNNKEIITIDEAELMEKFDKITDEALEKQVEEPTDELEVMTAQENKEGLKNYKTNTEAQEKAKEEALNSTVNDLLKDIQDTSKEC